MSSLRRQAADRGTGTLGLEIVEARPDVDAVIVPIGRKSVRCKRK